jgi:poly(3-hydroxybutyrate) depolymerase
MVREELVVDVQGVERSLVVHWGASDALLVVLHGSTEALEHDPLYPATRFENNYDADYFQPHRDYHGYTQMYLAASLRNGWFCWQNNGEEFGTCSRDDDGDDAAFVERAVQLANASELYVFGMSGGAKMAWKLACSADGVGVVGGALAPSLRTKAHCATPVAAFHGLEDPYVDVAVADDTAAWWRGAHNCSGAAGFATGLHDFRGCGAPGRLAYYRLAGVGHTIPGAPVVWSGLGGTSSYDSLAAMWAVWRGGDPAPVLDGAKHRAAAGLFPLLLLLRCFLYGHGSSAAAARTKARKGGDGDSGRLLYSGWNWQPKKKGWSPSSSTTSARRPVSSLPENLRPPSSSSATRSGLTS